MPRSRRIPSPSNRARPRRCHHRDPVHASDSAAERTSAMAACLYLMESSKGVWPFQVVSCKEAPLSISFCAILTCAGWSTWVHVKSPVCCLCVYKDHTSTARQNCSSRCRLNGGIADQAASTTSAWTLGTSTHLAQIGRPVEWCPLVPVLHIDLCAKLQQLLCSYNSTMSHRVV